MIFPCELHNMYTFHARNSKNKNSRTAFNEVYLQCYLFFVHEKSSLIPRPVVSVGGVKCSSPLSTLHRFEEPAIAGLLYEVKDYRYQ